MQVAFADNVYERVPDGIFELKWDYDPTLIFFAFLLIFYIRSLFLFKNKKPVKNWQVGLFFFGVLVNIAALSHLLTLLVISCSGRIWFAIDDYPHRNTFHAIWAPFFVIIRACQMV